MITLVLPMHPDGFAFDLSCPVVLCDVCGLPIDKAAAGNVLWWEQEWAIVPRPDGVSTGRLYFVHKGRCDRTLDPGSDAFSREMDEFMAQLARNYAEPIIGTQLEDSKGRDWRVRELRVLR